MDCLRIQGSSGELFGWDPGSKWKTNWLYDTVKPVSPCRTQWERWPNQLHSAISVEYRLWKVIRTFDSPITCTQTLSLRASVRTQGRKPLPHCMASWPSVTLHWYQPAWAGEGAAISSTGDRGFDDTLTVPESGPWRRKWLCMEILLWTKIIGACVYCLNFLIQLLVR